MCKEANIHFPKFPISTWKIVYIVSYYWNTKQNHNALWLHPLEGLPSESQIPNVANNVEQPKTSYAVGGGMHRVQQLFKNNLEVPQMSKHRVFIWSNNSTLTYPREMKTQ